MGSRFLHISMPSQVLSSIPFLIDYPSLTETSGFSPYRHYQLSPLLQQPLQRATIFDCPMPRSTSLKLSWNKSDLHWNVVGNILVQGHDSLIQHHHGEVCSWCHMRVFVILRTLSQVHPQPLTQASFLCQECIRLGWFSLPHTEFFLHVRTRDFNSPCLQMSDRLIWY